MILKTGIISRVRWLDSSAVNELQVLSISRDTIYLSNGGFVKLPNYVTSVQIHNDSLYVTYQQDPPINEGYIGRGAPGSTLATVITDSVSELRIRLPGSMQTLRQMEENL